MDLHRGLYEASKRAVDVAGSLVALGAAAPALAGVAVAVRLIDGAPVLFRQHRPGLRGELFELVKFRTMRPESQSEKGVGSDGSRLTRLGRLLRAASLDELPTLWNVLRGEMSFVGPRPLLPQYLERYTPEQARRHDVRPGITGWAQVHGRNAISWEERLRLDVWYVDHRGPLLDAWILALTVIRVIRREGINNSRAATMPEFGGRAPGGEGRDVE